MIFPRSAWKWPTFAIACGAALQLASGATPEYFQKEGGTCADDGGIAVPTEPECREAVLALGLAEAEAGLDACPSTGDCRVDFSHGGRNWRYDSVFPSPSGCVISDGTITNPRVGWVEGDNDECGNGSLDSMSCVCKTASGTTPEYFQKDGGTCADDGGSAVPTELECRQALIAMGWYPAEAGLNACPSTGVCQVDFSWGRRSWRYDSAYPPNKSPSGCVISYWNFGAPRVGWVAGDNDEPCGDGSLGSMFCVCKTTTSGPTGSPTAAGIAGSPTTPAITSAPWTIDFVGMDSDFSSSSGDEVVMRYEIGKDRAYEASLRGKDCAAGIADVTVNTTKARANINETHDLLTLSHSFDKSAIGNSTIWDNEAGKIEICQIVRLILPEGDGQVKMDIVEDTREVDIDFTLSADFAIENELGAGSVESAAGETNVSSYVSACKCNGPGNFSCNPEPLVPNTQLHVCITSVSADVQVKELKSMVVKQGAALMNVVLGGLVQISSIADRTYVEAENGVVVSTFVPTNVFDYAAGASINITGGIDMELASSARRLLADGDAVDAVGNGQVFDLEVDLQDEAIVLEGEGGWADSSGALLGGASALLGAALLLAYGMW